MTARSFFSLPRIASYSAIFSRISRQLFQQLVDGELREAVELQFEDGVDLPQGEAVFLAAAGLAVERDDDLVALAPRVQVFASLQRGSPMRE